MSTVLSICCLFRHIAPLVLEMFGRRKSGFVFRIPGICGSSVSVNLRRQSKLSFLFVVGRRRRSRGNLLFRETLSRYLDLALNHQIWNNFRQITNQSCVEILVAKNEPESDFRFCRHTLIVKMPECRDLLQPKPLTDLLQHATGS